MVCDKFGLYWPNVSGQNYGKFTTKLTMTLRTTDNRQFDQEASFEASTQKGLKGRNNHLGESWSIISNSNLDL